MPGPDTVAYSPAPGPPDADPTRRLPWLVLAGGVVVMAVTAAVFLLNRPAGRVDVTVGADPTSGVPRAAAATAGVPPTLVAPTAPATSTPTRPPAATPSPAPTGASAAAPPAATVPPAPGAAAPPPPPAAPVAQPTGAAPTTPPRPAPATGAPAPPVQPTAAATPAAPTAPPAMGSGSPPPAPPAPTPTPFAGQPAPAGGAGNTRADLDQAYGAPAGETLNKLVVYRKDNRELRVEFAPTAQQPAQQRASLLLAQLAQPVPLEQALQQSRPLLPRDAQPRSAAPEGNERFVVERFASQTLAQAFPPEAFAERNGQPGDLLVLYLKNAQGVIDRILVGIGNNPDAVIQRAGP